MASTRSGDPLEYVDEALRLGSDQEANSWGATSKKVQVAKDVGQVLHGTSQGSHGKAPGNPDITPDLKRTIAEGVMQEPGDRSVEQLAEEENELLAGLLLRTPR